MQYVGQTGRALKVRFREHIYKLRQGKRFNNFLYDHFSKSGHSFKDICIQPLEFFDFDHTLTKRFKVQARLSAELKWIKQLQTPYPLGLNDNIYHEGNISKNPDIDVFKILSITKRKRRSHGRRKNHNIKRKSKSSITLTELFSIYKNSGRHALLSKVTNLSISCLRKVDEEADNIYIQANPMYEMASIIQSYSQHVLHPHVDDASSHKRSFLKILYCNKGIDFIDLTSIFKDKRVQDKLPLYFKNSEAPMICYKYKKSTRNLLFNYNQVVSELDTDSSSQTSCDCANSRFCYQPAGHIITGDLSIIDDKTIKHIISKGPKYRLPADINFDTCYKEITESLASFCDKWCKRESAEKGALTAWKKAVIEIINIRIKFYKNNPSLLPRKSQININLLKNGIKKLHSKYVLVPADKASNNIIFI